MTYEELFDAYRQVVSKRNMLADAGDMLWAEVARLQPNEKSGNVALWEALRGFRNDPPVDEWAEC